MSCLRPIRTCFSVMCPRLDENDGDDRTLTKFSPVPVVKIKTSIQNYVGVGNPDDMLLSSIKSLISGNGKINISVKQWIFKGYMITF